MMRWTNWIDQVLDDTQAVLLSVLIKLGPFAVALMPALFTAYAIYRTFEPEAGQRLALAFAVVVGLAIETVGIVATHTAIDLYNAWQEKKADWVKLVLMIALIPFYVLGVSGTVFLAQEAFAPLVWALGIASPWLTVVVYIAVALARDLRRIEQSSEQAEQASRADVLDERQHKRRIELRKLELEAEQAKRQAELKAQVQIEKARVLAEAKPEPAQSQHICDCGRDFATIQALNAHSRFCDVIIGYSENGNRKVKSNGV